MMAKHISDRNRFSIIQPKLDRCLICGARPVEKHEVFYGSGFRTKSKDYGMVVALCHICHMNIHNNQENDVKLKKWAQAVFEEEYGHRRYMQVFKKNYLDEELWKESPQSGMASV